MILALLTRVLAQLLSPQSGTPTHGEWGDQCDGTYSYLVYGGAGIQDLVQKRFGGHVVEHLTRISPELSWGSEPSSARSRTTFQGVLADH